MKKMLLKFLMLFPIISFAQYSSENGYLGPCKTDIIHPLRVLVACIELDQCGSFSYPPCISPIHMPVDIDKYFDPVLPSSGPVGYFTKYYYDASFGNFIVLGDYVNQVVHVPSCNYGDYSAFNQALTALAAQNNNQLPLAHSGTLSFNDFDNYDLDPQYKGMVKPNNPNGRWDCVIYLVLNYPGLGGRQGNGITNLQFSGSIAGHDIDMGSAFGHTGDVGSIDFY